LIREQRAIFKRRVKKNKRISDAPVGDLFSKNFLSI